jgi:hypothetical protein
MNKKINISDKNAWSEMDWDDPVQPEALKKTDGQIARARGVRHNKKKISEGTKKAFQNPEVKKKHKDARVASEKRAEVKAVRKKAGESLKTNEKWKKNHKAAIEALQNDPVRLAEYKKNYAKGNSKKYDNLEYWENYYKGIAKRDADEEYTKKRLDASRAKICKKVHTPLGVFDSITAASIAYGMGNSETMRHRIKSPNFPDFYIVED